MKKHYFLVFGIKGLSVKDVSFLLEDKLDIVFKAHESGFSGQYLLYSGSMSDKISLEVVNDENRGGEFNYSLDGFELVLYISNYRGKNQDNLSKNNYVKHHLSQINGLYLLRESVVEVS